MLVRRPLRQVAISFMLGRSFSQSKKKVFKYSEDQYQKSEELMQFELPAQRFRSKYAFLNN
jgi:hypothetical protein